MTRVWIQIVPKSRLLVMVAILALASPACARQKEGTQAAKSDHAATRTASENEMMNTIGLVFRQKNPRLSQIGVLELRSWDFLGPRVVVGWGIVSDRVFRGDFRDEMFGVFVLDESLTRVERVLDVFPTPRWFDYQLQITRLTGDSVYVAGAGATYGDDPMLRAYKWR
ncbi:MAG TPA: hypothetical protein VFP58_13095 [Candidatus Eisenbacteria bacterium]|nr:hypothetical protein [Candidatus Eisenbacteria bacterium]